MTQKLHTDPIGTGFLSSWYTFLTNEVLLVQKKNYILKHLVCNYIFDELSKTFLGGNVIVNDYGIIDDCG